MDLVVWSWDSAHKIFATVLETNSSTTLNWEEALEAMRSEAIDKLGEFEI